MMRIGFKNLQRNPRRTITVLVTVALGTSSLFLYDGFNTGSVNQYREDTIRSHYGHGQLNTKGYLGKIHKKAWKHWIENPESLRQELKQNPQVLYTFPRVEFYALLSNGNTTVSGRGQAVDGREEAQFFNSLNIISGKALSEEPDGILLGKGLADALELKPGDTVSTLATTIHGTMNGIDLTVVGVFNTGIKDFDDTYFRIQLARGMTLLDTTKVESIALGLRSWEDWDSFAALMKQKLPELEATSFAVLDKAYYQNSVDWLNAQFQFIQAIILMIVFLGILNTVSTAILERKQEIGNLRANGDSGWDVLKLLFWEAIFLGGLGSLAGLCIAYVLNLTAFRHGILMPPAPAQTLGFYTFIELRPEMAAKTFLLGLMATLLGTTIAGVRVLKLSIAEALRST